MIVGSLVRLATHTGIFRVLATPGCHLTVMSRDANQPGRLRVPATDVIEHKKQRRPVYSTSSYTFPVKSWGEPPEGPGGVLILDQRQYTDLLRICQEDDNSSHLSTSEHTYLNALCQAKLMASRRGEARSLRHAHEAQYRQA